MITIRAVSARLQCSKHPAERPDQYPAGYRPECRRCARILDIHQAHAALIELLKTTPRRHNDGKPATPPPATTPQQMGFFFFY